MCNVIKEELVWASNQRQASGGPCLFVVRVLDTIACFMLYMG